MCFRRGLFDMQSQIMYGKATYRRRGRHSRMQTNISCATDEKNPNIFFRFPCGADTAEKGPNCAHAISPPPCEFRKLYL